MGIRIGGGNYYRWPFCSKFWELAGVAHGFVLEGWIILPVEVVAFVCDLELCIYLQKIQGMIVNFGTSFLFACLPARRNDEGKMLG